MSISPLFYTDGPLEEYFVDKDSGLPLAGGTISFWRDADRNVPKPVYTLTGSGPYTYTFLPNPITLSSVGTVQDGGGNNVVIYYYPFLPDYIPPLSIEPVLDLYYVVVEDSNGVVQFTREAWPNAAGGATINPDTLADFATQNQISNGQFTQVFLNQGIANIFNVVTAASLSLPIGPDWNLVVSGTGSVTVTRNALSGISQVPTNAPYELQIETTSGITACYLTQTFPYNSGLWTTVGTNQVWLSGTFVARFVSGTTSNLPMYYSESAGANNFIEIINDADLSSSYQQFQGTTKAFIPNSGNTGTGENAYSTIQIGIPASVNIAITGIQVVPVYAPVEVAYELNSSNRNEAFMGDYYIPRLNTRHAASILTAWDFNTNPYQFGITGTITNTPAYIADQTVAQCGVTGNIAFAVSSVTGGLQLTTAGTNDYIILLQYLKGDEARQILGTSLSCNVWAYKDGTSHPVTMQVTMCRGSSSASIPSLASGPSIIGTSDINGNFTLGASNWTVIARSGLPTAKATISPLTATSQLTGDSYDYSFTGWEVLDSASISNTNYYAMIITFAYVDASTVITVNSVSCVQGDIPARPIPKSTKAVLLECQKYYETSYDLGVLPGTASTTGIQLPCVYFVSGSNVLAAGNFAQINFNTVKRAAPTVTYYSPDAGTSGSGYGVLLKDGNAFAGATDYTVSSVFTGTITTRFVSYVPANNSNFITASNAANHSYQASLSIQFTADARLGIV